RFYAGRAAVRLMARREERARGRPPIAGVHPRQAYAPLNLPPAPPSPTADPSVDRRFEKKLRWLLILVLLLALFITGGNVIVEAKAWGEMPSDNALVRVEVGT